VHGAQEDGRQHTLLTLEAATRSTGSLRCLPRRTLDQNERDDQAVDDAVNGRLIKVETGLSVPVTEDRSSRSAPARARALAGPLR
jgi:hypothetical protein